MIQSRIHERLDISNNAINLEKVKQKLVEFKQFLKSYLIFYQLVMNLSCESLDSLILI